MEYDRFQATDEGLAIAKALAEQLGIEFDREGTRVHANQMHDLYFAAIVRIAELPPTTAQFAAGAFRLVNAFVPESEGTGRVFFDEQLDMWLFMCTQLVTIMACKQLEPDQVEDLVASFVANLNVPFNPHLHEVQRNGFLKFLRGHADCLEITTALTRAMVVFAICHEIGHVVLRHHEPGTVPSCESEFAADRKAAELFIKIVKAGKSAHPIYVSPKLTGAPVLLMFLFDLLGRYRRKLGRPERRSTTHPEPRDRAIRLLKLLEIILGDGRYVLDGFSHAIEEIAHFADLPPIVKAGG